MEQHTVVKKVRLTPSEAKQLTSVAKRRGTTESEVLRMGIHSESVREDRQRYVKGLKEFLTRPEPPKEEWEWPG